MPKTLLAVDDSATMRKVLEITFSGEDYRVLTAENRSAALAKLSEQPEVIIVDTALDNDDGYALAKEIRARNSSALIVLLASRYHPYDAARGKDATAVKLFSNLADAKGPPGSYVIQYRTKIRRVLLCLQLDRSYGFFVTDLLAT